MPNLTYTVSDFQPFTKIVSADVNSRFNDIKTLLNTTGLDDTNIQNAGITRSTKLKAGSANHVVINDSNGAMSSEATLALSRGGLATAISLTPSDAGKAITINNTYNGVTLTPITSGSSVEIVDMLANMRKSGLETSISNPNMIVEAFDDSTTLTLSLAKAYSPSDTTTIWLDQNVTSLAPLDAISEGGASWTASMGSAGTDGVAGHFIEGVGGIKHTATNLNGSGNISKTFTSFSLQEKCLRVNLYLDTIANLTRATIQVETSGGNSVTYYIPVAQLQATTVNFINIDFRNTPDATAGTWDQGNITKVYLGLTTSTTQTINATWDYLRSVDMYSVVNSQQAGVIIPIYDGTNMEMMTLVSEDATYKGKYTMAAALSNSYAAITAKAKFVTGAISGSEMNFDSTLTGSALSNAHALRRVLFPSVLSGKTLRLTGTYRSDKFQVTSTPTSQTLTVSGDQTARFKSGDKIVLFKYERNYPRWSSAYNSSLGANFKVLTLSQNSSYGAPSTTITTSETFSIGSDPTTSWYITRLSLFLKYFVGNATSNEVLTTADLTGFIPNDINNATSAILQNTLFGATTNWTSLETANAGGYTPYKWQTGGGTVDGYGTSAYMGWSGGAATSASETSILVRNLENYDINKLPIEITCSVLPMPAQGGGVYGSTQFGVLLGHDGSTVNVTKGNGAYINFTTSGSGSNTVAWYVVQGGSAGAAQNTSYVINNPTTPGAYRVRMQVYTNRIKLKVWASTDTEPAAWQVDTTTFNYTSQGNYLCMFGYANNPAQSGSCYVKCTNFKVVSLSTGYTIYSDIPLQSGQKLVIDANMTRQDTTNDLPAIRKFGGILV